MEDEMIGKLEIYNTHVSTGGWDRPLPVGMYTDEHSETCTIRFGNSFTLNVVSPQDLIAFAQEIETFAKRAYELHYGDFDDTDPFTFPGAAENERPDDCTTDADEDGWGNADTENPPAAACWKDPNDPINW